MRIRVLELPSQAEGDSYRTPWLLVVDDLQPGDAPTVDATLEAKVHRYGGAGLLVMQGRVELPGDER